MTIIRTFDEQLTGIRAANPDVRLTGIGFASQSPDAERLAITRFVVIQ